MSRARRVARAPFRSTPHPCLLLRVASRAVFAAPRARGNERVCADLGQFPNPFQIRGGGAPVVVHSLDVRVCLEQVADDLLVAAVRRGKQGSPPSLFSVVDVCSHLQHDPSAEQVSIMTRIDQLNRLFD